MKISFQLNKTPLAYLMSHPEKAGQILNEAKGRRDDFVTRRTIGQTITNPPMRPATSKGDGNLKPPGQARLLLKKTIFRLEAPSADSVKLAADFTDWEKFPLKMTRSEDGIWSIVVPLSPGKYSYRFIVDGDWCDDPQAGFYEPSPFGSVNAVVKVT